MRLTFAEQLDDTPSWSADGTTVVFRSTRGGKGEIWSKRVDGQTEAVLEFAEENDAELLIMDSHVVRPGAPGRGPTTISYRVAVAAQCPVLLIKGEGAEAEDA